MPIDLVLVRHGESEGNIAQKATERGDHSHFTQEFRNRHNSTWRLSPKGRHQAETAGQWIRQNMAYLLPFNRYYVSEYTRALETAARLGLPNAEWKVDFYLRERDYGALDAIPDSERYERFADAMRRRNVDSFFWAPPDGESMAQLCLRIDRVIETLHRECSEKKVIIVAHGEVMWAFRVRLERMLQSVYKRLDTSKHPFDHIHNCQILHYTRRRGIEWHPSGTTAFYGRMRSICPTNLTLSRNEWEPIERRSYSNEDLLAMAAADEKQMSGIEETP
jgi:NAD+ kinase